jgi:hypothetical protein
MSWTRHEFMDRGNRPAGSIKRFGVVSVVADKFVRSYVGFTAFTNKVAEIDVTAWGIDAAYADQLGKVAAGLLSAEYVAAPYSPDDCTKISQTNWRGAPNWSSIETASSPQFVHCLTNSVNR